jgi:hypothetical protein
MKNKFVQPSFIVIFFVLLLTQAARPTPAYACSCASSPRTLQEQVVDYDAVFLGRVLRVEYADGSEMGLRSVHMQVFTSWKGASKPLVTIRTGSGHGDCGFDFSEGASYLVYAYGWSTTIDLGTNLCSPTGRVADEGEELIETTIGKFPANGSGKVVTQEDIAALGEGTQLSDPNGPIPTEESSGYLVPVLVAVATLALGGIGFLLYRRRSGVLKKAPGE